MPEGRKTYRSAGAAALWYLWLLFAGGNLIDLAVRGHDHVSAVIGAVLVLGTGVAFVAVLRPRVIADAESLLLRNPLRDIRVPWGAVTGVEAGDLLRVRYEVAAPGAPPRQRVAHGWALQSSRRGRLKSEMRARRRATGWTAGNPGFAKLPEEARTLAAQPTAVRAAAELNTLAAEARERGAQGGEATIAWSWASAAALAVPALLLVLAIIIR